MFENLTERLTGIFNRLNSKGRLTDKDIDEALSLVRRSLLEADVNFRVARDFVARVKERAQGAEVLESLTPGQQVVKIVHDELTELLGGGPSTSSGASTGSGRAGGITLSSQPVSALMLVGPARLRQDHHGGQDCPGAAQTGPSLPAHRRRPAPSRRHPAVGDPGPTVGHPGLLGRPAVV